MSEPVYVGIDLACAKGKRLPVCFVRTEPGSTPKSRLTPLVVNLDRIPRGKGNREIGSVLPFQDAARCVVHVLKTIADEMRWSIKRIAIDAPAAPSTNGIRSCERQLKDEGISSFPTPTPEKMDEVVKTCKIHLNEKRPLNRLPHANQIWMFYGFELFKELRNETEWETIEVYPNAIIRKLGCTKHKSKECGYSEQLTAVAQNLG